MVLERVSVLFVEFWGPDPRSQAGKSYRPSVKCVHIVTILLESTLRHGKQWVLRMRIYLAYLVQSLLQLTMTGNYLDVRENQSSYAGVAQLMHSIGVLAACREAFWCRGLNAVPRC